MKADEKEKAHDPDHLKEKLTHLENILSRHLPEIVKNIEGSSENNSKFVNLIQENVRVQNDNMNYLEKKLEFIDKTIELKTKHFDEIMKTNSENNDTLVRMVQANLASQDNTLEKIAIDINSSKYLFVVAIISIGALIWGINLHFYKQQVRRLIEAKSNSADTIAVLTSLEDTKRALVNLQEENQNVRDVLRSEGKGAVLAERPRKGIEITASADTQKLITAIQKENRELINALQHSNQELLKSIAAGSAHQEKIKPAPAPAPKKPAVNKERPKPHPPSEPPEEEEDEEELDEE